MAKRVTKKTAKKAASKKTKPVEPAFEGHPIYNDADGERDWTFIGAVGLGRNILVMSCRSYKGRRALDLRQFFLADDKEYRPTGKGVWMPADVVASVLDTLVDRRDAIDKALEL